MPPLTITTEILQNNEWSTLHVPDLDMRRTEPWTESPTIISGAAEWRTVKIQAEETPSQRDY